MPFNDFQRPPPATMLEALVRGERLPHPDISLVKAFRPLRRIQGRVVEADSERQSVQIVPAPYVPADAVPEEEEI